MLMNYCPRGLGEVVMRKQLSTWALFAAGLISASSQSLAGNCPFHEEGDFPWSANIPATVKGDMWAWVYLELDKNGYAQRCWIGETDISGDETKSNVCRSFVSGWKATPLMKDGMRVAGMTRRKFVIIGDRHQKMLEEARAAWFAQHPDDNPACYPGRANY